MTIDRTKKYKIEDLFDKTGQWQFVDGEDEFNMALGRYRGWYTIFQAYYENDPDSLRLVDQHMILYVNENEVWTPAIDDGVSEDWLERHFEMVEKILDKS